MVHVGAVGVVALDAQERVALIKQYRHPVGKHLWELPAGLIDVAGEPLVHAAARELAEEADLHAARWDLLAEVHTSPGCSNEKIRLFLARELSSVPDDDRHRRTHEEAELEVHWFALDEAVSMALSGEITNAACLIGVLGAAHARDRGWDTLRPASSAT
jgi:ADP-ribose pyrophosphatase